MNPTLRALGPILLLLAAAPSPGADGDVPSRLVYHEAPDDPPAAVDPRADRTARSPGQRLQVGPYVSVQVNVDEVGDNILGDAANEPSIAVDPLDGDNLVIGWRQFNNVASNFRQAGWAYSHDGGTSWTFPGVLEPGVFRSDPVLDADLTGTFFYNSLTGSLTEMDVWRSPTSGVSWLGPVPAFGGDKNWLTVDKTTQATSGHMYAIWQRFFGCCGFDTVTRSTDGGVSFQSPEDPPSSPTFGTLAVGPDGSLYAAGIQGVSFQNFDVFVVDRRQPNGQWSGGPVALGGSMSLGATPNPGGLLGQANVAVDHSSGPTAGDVYLLASVNPPGADPMDVHLSRSTDKGASWSPPVRVNDDTSTTWQWFAAHSVAPNGRIDAIWLDTRATGSSTKSQLFYAYSWDGGASWFENVQVSPTFDSTIGWPNQSKIGDYMTIVANASAADVAYAATFNGEQDVYHVSVFPDCNDNGISDLEDIANQTSADANGNNIPDECEGGLTLLAPVPGVAGQMNTFTSTGATPGKEVFFVGGLIPGSHEVPGCPGTVGMKEVKVLGVDVADAQGTASITIEVPPAIAGKTALFQAVVRATCAISNLVEHTFP